MINLMHFSVDITHLKLLVAHKASKPSKTTRIGLEHGLLKLKVWLMEMVLSFKKLVVPSTQPSLTLVAPSSLSHLTSSINLLQNGVKLCLTSTVAVIRLSVQSQEAAMMSLKYLNQWASNSVITTFKWHQRNICLNLDPPNATSSSISANCQERMPFYT